MPAWRDLSTDELRALITYVDKLSTERHASSSVANAPPGEEPRALYAASCASCHGDAGAGDGPAAGALARAPTSFALQRASIAHGTTVLRDGVPGTAMPPWRVQLTDTQRDGLAAYVRSLSAQPEAP